MGDFLRLDRAEVEQVVHHLRQAIGLSHHAIGQLPHDSGIVGRRHRLREEGQRADRRLQLVAHVGNEVAAHTLYTARLGNVTRECDRADDFGVAAERERAQLQDLARRAVELELAFRAVSIQCDLQQIGNGLLGEELAGACLREATRHRIPDDLAADPVDDDDRIGRLVERGEQPMLHRFRMRDAIFVVVDVLPNLAEHVTRAEILPHGPSGDDPPDDCQDNEQRGHDSRAACRLTRTDP